VPLTPAILVLYPAVALARDVLLITTVATVVWAFMFVVLSEAVALLLLLVIGLATLRLRRSSL
jgi:hypothetical protein